MTLFNQANTKDWNVDDYLDATKPVTRLYHVDLGLPQGCPTSLTGAVGLTPTRHAMERAMAKGFKLPTVAPAGARVVEVEMIGERVTKLVVRFSYDSSRDVCLVLKGNTVLTAWLNRKGDCHATLDRSRYICP